MRAFAHIDLHFTYIFSHFLIHEVLPSGGTRKSR